MVIFLARPGGGHHDGLIRAQAAQRRSRAHGRDPEGVPRGAVLPGYDVVNGGLRGDTDCDGHGEV